MSEAGGSPEPRRRHRRDSEGDHQDVAAEEGRRNRVKSEPDDDIKDFAETTMNELLGWYGYDKVNTKDTRGLNFALNHFSSSSSPRAASPHGGSCSEDETRDTGGSRTPLLDTDTQASTGGTILCTWCQKSGLKLFTLKTGTGESKAFCSELCFNQCRRAAFKKNRVCDWCKHVRHTVNYVDFQDGEHQLQFCSDKCLNQYKMNIFCKETQAYLQLHPQLQEACRSSSGSGSNLITPDLWLRDCKEAVNGHPSSSLQSEDENCAGSGGGCNGSGGEVEEIFATKSGSSNGSGVSNPLLWEDAETRREPKMLTRHHHRDKSRRVGRPSSRHKETHESSSHYRPPSSAKSPNLPHLPHGILSPPSPSLPAPPPLVNGSSPSLHSSTSPNLPQPPPPHPPPSSSASSIPPGLPPPLLNSDYFRPHFTPPMYHPSLSLLAQQQQLENFLRMQHGLGARLGMPHPPHFPPHFPEPLLSAPPPAAAPAAPPPPLPSSLIPPATVLVPYPVIIPLPLPIPIPIPIPLPHSLSKKIQESNKSTPSECCSESSGQSQSKRVDSVITKLINNHRESGSDSTLTESQVSGRLKTRSPLPGPQMKRALDEDNDNLTSQPVPLTSPRERDVFRTFTKDPEEENQMTLTRSKSKTSREQVGGRDSKRQRLRDKYSL